MPARHRPRLLSGWPLALLVLTAGCLGEAERGNPLDPLSDNFRDAGAVTGRVTSFFPPFEGLVGARVELIPLDGGATLVGVSGADGRFSITDVSAGESAVSVQLEGYSPISDTIAVEVGLVTEIDLPINGIPSVAVLTIHTEHLNRWFPQDPLFQLVVEADVDDPDGLGDVADVRLSIPSQSFSDTLRVVDGEPGRYRRVFAESELPVAAQELLGIPILIEAIDHQGVQGTTDPVQVVRIIASFPQALEPANLEVVGSNPELKWQLLELPYNFTHRVDLILVPVPGQEIPVRQYGGIAQTDTTFVVPDALDPGTYSWTVSAIDVFGNRSRSRPLGFTVSGAAP